MPFQFVEVDWSHFFNALQLSCQHAKKFWSALFASLRVQDFFLENSNCDKFCLGIYWTIIDLRLQSNFKYQGCIPDSNRIFGFVWNSNFCDNRKWYICIFLKYFKLSWQSLSKTTVNRWYHQCDKPRDWEILGPIFWSWKIFDLFGFHIIRRILRKAHVDWSN